MPRPIRPWFRFYVEAFHDRKIRRLPPAQRWLWVAILGAARDSCEPGRLMVAPNLPMSTQELADYAGVSVKEVRQGLSAMELMHMITVADDLVTVTNWDARQFESDDVTKRTRDHRERSPEQGRNVPKNVPGNTPETETETETEEERAPRAKRAHQAPDNFAPNETNRRVAAEHGVDPDRLVAQFLDHHRARGSTFKDWHLAFNTWIRREKPGVVTQFRPEKTYQDARTLERPPDGLTDDEYVEWAQAQAAKR